MTAVPVRYSPGVEDVKPGEGETIAALNATFDTILRTVAEDSGHAVRAVHAKAHGILEGTMTIPPGLPPELAQGMFATPSLRQGDLRQGDLKESMHDLARAALADHAAASTLADAAAFAAKTGAGAVRCVTGATQITP